MGIYSRYTTAFLILALLSPQAFAKVRIPVKPSAESVLKNQTATTGAISTPAGDAAFFGPDKVYSFATGDSVGPTVREVKSAVGTPSYPYGPGAAYPNDPALNPPSHTPKATVKPQLVVPKANILAGLKTGLKANLPQIALGAAVSAAIAGVGWVIDEGSQAQPILTLKNPTSSFSGFPVHSTFSGSNYLGSCSAPQTIGTVRFHSSQNNFVLKFSLSGSPPSGWTYINNCTSFGIAIKGGTSADIVHSTTPVTDSDLSMLDPWVSSQSATWLGGLIKEVCNGSLNPGQCYEGMVDRSKGMISGPAAVPGPSTSKTSVYAKPDGSTGTRTETTTTSHTLSYGKDYFDVDTERKTVVTDDGQVVSETTEADTSTPEDVADAPVEEPETPEPEYTFDDTPFPEVEPFYEQKYPDGLQGVWDQAKADIDNSNFLSFLRSFVPSFSGSCPSFGMSFAIGSMANFGTHEFQSLCYVFDFIKVILMVSAVFLARQLTFGG